MRQLDWNRIDTERKLNMQIVSCRNNMSASTEQVVSNKENVMQAKKAVVIAEKRYDVGKGTVLELNSSQVSLHRRNSPIISPYTITWLLRQTSIRFWEKNKDRQLKNYK